MIQKTISYPPPAYLGLTLPAWIHILNFSHILWNYPKKFEIMPSYLTMFSAESERNFSTKDPNDDDPSRLIIRQCCNRRFFDVFLWIREEFLDDRVEGRQSEDRGTVGLRKDKNSGASSWVKDERSCASLKRPFRRFEKLTILRWLFSILAVVNFRFPMDLWWCEEEVWGSEFSLISKLKSVWVGFSFRLIDD